MSPSPAPTATTRARSASRGGSDTSRTARGATSSAAPAADALLFRLAREQWLATERLDVTIEGFEACAELFGVDEPHRRSPLRRRALARRCRAAGTTRENAPSVDRRRRAGLLAPGKSLGLRKMLIGREVESARLATALASARAGAGAAFVLVGEPGIGKTTLLRDLVEQAGAMTVLETAGRRVRGGSSVRGARSTCCTPVLHRLDALPEAQAVALSTALALGPPGVVDRFAVGVATLGLLAAAAEDGPALIVVDDLQWVDSASRDALSFAARRLAAIPAIFVAAQRADAPRSAGSAGRAGRPARPRRRDAGCSPRTTDGSRRRCWRGSSMRLAGTRSRWSSCLTC